jgi:hypothetical protein
MGASGFCRCSRTCRSLAWTRTEFACGSRRWPGELRLPRVPAVSIESIRGCFGGAGREFVRLCDLHFASRGHTTAGRIDVDRVIADDRLDDEVDQIASRIARLAPEVIARAKADRALPLV